MLQDDGLKPIKTLSALISVEMGIGCLTGRADGHVSLSRIGSSLLAASLALCGLPKNLAVSVAVSPCAAAAD